MGEVVHFVAECAVRNAVRIAWNGHLTKILRLLPGADIEHVGSTALPGTLTKGDLDIQVRVPREQFPAAEAVLARHFARNEKSSRSVLFAPFESHSGMVPVGIQLTAIDSELDIFWRFREVLRARADLRRRYDALKRKHEGTDMEDYRRAKGRFFDELRLVPEFWSARLKVNGGSPRRAVGRNSSPGRRKKTPKEG